MAWIYRTSKGRWWYLESRIAGNRFHRALKTKDRAIAEAELAKQLALEKAIPRPDGRIRWQEQDLAQFAGMPGQSRVARQNYACAAQAMRALSDSDRWKWLLKPTPKITALAAIGRLPLEIMRMAADEVCEKRMTYRAAVAFVRKLLGRHSAGRKGTLRNAVRSAVKVYRDMHPETTGQEIAATLRGLAADFERVEQKGPARVHRLPQDAPTIRRGRLDLAGGNCGQGEAGAHEGTGKSLKTRRQKSGCQRLP